MTVVTVVKPTVEPVSVDDVKQHSRIDTNDDNAYLFNLIQSATNFVEDYTRRYLITRTIDYKFDGGLRNIEIPGGNLQSVTSVTYIDTAGSEQTLSTSVYDVDTDSQPGRIVLAYGQSWPSTRDKIHNVTVRAVVGYGSVKDIPKGIRGFILALVDHLYEHRTTVTELNLSEDNVLNPGVWLFRYQI